MCNMQSIVPFASVLFGAVIAALSTWLFENVRTRRLREADLYKERVQIVAEFMSLAVRAYRENQDPVSRGDRLAKTTGLGARATLAFGNDVLPKKFVATIGWLEAASHYGYDDKAKEQAQRQAVELAEMLRDVTEAQAKALGLIRPALSVSLSDADIVRLKTGRYGYYLDLFAQNDEK